MEWLARKSIQLALAPLASLLFSFALPASLLLAWFMYRWFTRSRYVLVSPTKQRAPADTPSLWFKSILVVLVTIYIYAQCTLLRHLYYTETGRLTGATHSNELCRAAINHPGRNTPFIEPACNAAKDALNVDPLDEAVRQWTDLFFSFGLPSWFAEPADTDLAKRPTLNVTVPFGIGRLMLLILLGMCLHSWFTPAVTYVQSGINRMRAGPAAA